MRRNKYKSLIIMFVFIALFIMTTGYSIYQKRLNIGGISRIDYKNWNIHISNIEMIETDSGVDVIAPSYTNTTAKFNSRITKPGGYIKYKITIKNDGIIDGVLGAINITDTENSVISYEVTGMNVDDELKAHQSKDIYVKAIYDSTKVDTATTNKSNVSVNLTFVQLEGYVPQSVTPDSLISNAVTTGDGLYADPYEDGRYIFKGTSPNNYIEFNNETWRILSVEDNGTIKIIKNDSIGEMSFDAAGNRPTDLNTFCVSNEKYGCSVWAATKNLINQPNLFVTYFPDGNNKNDVSYSGTVSKDSSINEYLNNEYYNSINSDRKYIVAGNFNVGTPGGYGSPENISNDINQEKDYVWTGKVGLITLTEIMRGTTNNTCLSISDGQVNGSNCGNNNWLKPSTGYKRTISPRALIDNSCVYHLSYDGYIWDGTAQDKFDIYPVVYLTNTIKLKGTGNIDDYYKIVK